MEQSAKCKASLCTLTGAERHRDSCANALHSPLSESRKPAQVSVNIQGFRTLCPRIPPSVSLTCQAVRSLLPECETIADMPLYREQGVVLRTQKLGEADRIVTLLTLGRGIIRVVAKGVRRTSSRFGARLEPFMVADLQLYEGRTLDTITQASMLGAYGPHISEDYDRYRAGSAMVETAERLSEGGPAPEQYRLLVGALRTLAQATIAPDLLRDGYLLRAIAAAGWAPGFVDCVRCGALGPHQIVVVQIGGVVCENCSVPGAPRLQSGSIALLSALLAGDWDAAVAATDVERGQASGIVAAYTQWHIERGLRSLRTN